MSKKYSIANARDQLASIVHEVEGGDTVTLTRRGRPVAVLLSLPEFRRLRGHSRGLREALASFRASIESDPDSGLDTEDLAELRDRSEGRSVDLG